MADLSENTRRRSPNVTLISEVWTPDAPRTDLVGENTPVALSVHPNLPAETVAILQVQYLGYLHPDMNRWAAKLGLDADKLAAKAAAIFSPEQLAHLNLSVAASTLSRLSKSAPVGQLAFELNKRDHANKKYFRPSAWTEVWHNPAKMQSFRRSIVAYNDRYQSVVGRRFKEAPGWQKVLQGKLSDEERQLRAHNDRQMREIQLAWLLIAQAELAALPLRLEEIDRRIDTERKLAEHLRHEGYVGEARSHERYAAELARKHERDFLNERQRENVMIFSAVMHLTWNFVVEPSGTGLRGDRLVAGLVGEALGRDIKPGRVRSVVTGRKKARTESKH